MDCSACIALGVAIITPSSSMASNSSSESTTRASGATSRASASASAFESHSPTTSPAPLSTTRCMRCRPIQPTPRQPIFGLELIAYASVLSPE